MTRPSDRDEARLRAALDLWRDDAEREAARVDVHGDLADRVVGEALRRSQAAPPPTAARWYAAAAPRPGPDRHRRRSRGHDSATPRTALGSS